MTLSERAITAADTLDRIVKAADGRPLTMTQRADFAKSLDIFAPELLANTRVDVDVLTAIKSADADPAAAASAIKSWMAKPQGTLAAHLQQPYRQTSSAFGGTALRNPGGFGAAYIEAKSAIGAKSFLEVGTTVVSLPLRVDPITDPRRAKFVVDLMPTQQTGTGMFSYLQETARDLQAAVAEPGTIKPVSTITLQRVDERLKAIAHVSEPVDRYTIEDAPNLAAFLEGELAYGLSLGLDAYVVAAILAGATDGGATVTLALIRDAITTLQGADIEPSAIAMGPADWQTVEAAALAAFAANPNLSPNDAFTRRLYGYPVTVTTSLAAGTAIVGDFRGSAALYEDGRGVQVDVSTATSRLLDTVQVSDFQLNQIVWRAERRAALALFRPAGFVKLSA